MTRVAVVVGSAASETGSGSATLPASDRGAIALALARFAGDVEVYAADSEARCFARAAGVERLESFSQRAVGAADLILIGRGGCAGSGDLLPARLAEAFDAALVYEVVDLRRDVDRLLVTRDRGRGARDLLGVRGRAILVIADSVERGTYVSRHRLNAARVASGALDLEAGADARAGGVDWKRVTPRVRLGDFAARVAGSADERRNALLGIDRNGEAAASLVRGSAEECARHLVRYLSHHGFVDRALDAGLGSSARERADSQPSAPRVRKREVDAACLPIRLRRRPRALHEPPPEMRGPFELGVDV